MSIQEVLDGQRQYHFECGDCISVMNTMPEASVDLVLGSGPYCDARTYGIDAVYDCQQWVSWMLKVTEAAVRVSKGLVLWVAAGVQRDLCYWPACEGLMWEWWKRGNQLWRPCIWHKVDEKGGGSGIPGSGGDQWFRNDWEFVMAFKREGWLPWADNCAMGHAPKVAEVGGEMSNRTADGRRINEGVARQDIPRDQRWGGSTRNADGDMQDGSRKRNPPGANRRPSGKYKKTSSMYAKEEAVAEPEAPLMDNSPAGHDDEGNMERTDKRPFPKVANPGNVVRARVGGGHMGNKMCHLGEAPYPEKLCEFFIRSFCPVGGVVLDPFSGSGTTCSVAVQLRRRGVGLDIRQSQCDIGKRRVETETPMMLGF